MKPLGNVENNGRLLLGLMTALLVMAWAGTAAYGSDFTLPKSVLENETDFVKSWGPASVTRSDPGGSSMDFTFTGLTGSGTALRDDYPVLDEYGQNGGTHNADFSNFTGYSVIVENLAGPAVWVSLFINTGFTNDPDLTADTYWQLPEWRYVGPGERAIVTLDFDNAQADHIYDNPVPHTGGGLNWPNWGVYAINDYDRHQVTSIGVQVADFSKGAKSTATVRLSSVTVTLESSTTLTKCSDNITYHVMVDTNAVDLMGADYTINYDSAKLSFVSAVVGDLLNTGAGEYIFTYQSSAGALRINSSHLGTGVNGPGEIAEVTFQATGATVPGSTSLTFSDIDLRDSGNQTLPSTWTGASVAIDCVAPTIAVTLDTLASPWTCYNTAPTVDIIAGDDYDLDCVKYKIDAGSWSDIACGLSGTSDTTTDWALLGFGSLSEGSHTYYFKSTDDAGNESSEDSVAFTKDTVVPSAVTDFTATVGHNQIVLDWTNPGSDVDRIYLYRNDWTDYPEYGTADPSYPGVGGYDVETDVGAVVTYTDTLTNTTRGIYAYRAVVYDCAGNYATAGSGDHDRATSYFLGDIASVAGSWGPNYDGLVSGFDYNPFSGCYWSSPATDSTAECDFAPTIEPTRGRFGIPVPDDYVGFEDLMIFSMNYGNVPPPSPPGAPVLGVELASAGLVEDALSYRVSLREVSEAGDMVELALVVEGNDVFKGLSAEVGYDPSGLEFASVMPSEALMSGSRVLFMGDEVEGVVRVDLAALGGGVGIGGNGPVAMLSFLRRGESSSSVKIASVDARDVDNNVLLLTVEDEVQVKPGLPEVFALRGNSPNPFTGSTEISYDIPRESSVMLRIYNIHGQVVRTLVDGAVSAGHHSETWDGLDSQGRKVSAGVYFCEMRSGSFVSTHKLMISR